MHADSRKPHRNILRELCRCTPAQISHNLSTQRAQRSKNFDLDRNFQSRSKFLIALKMFSLDVSISPQKIGPRWVARSKISFSIEISISIKISNFLIFGPSGAHFWMPPHIFHTNFLGPVGNAPRTSFAQFSRAHGLFSNPKGAGKLVPREICQEVSKIFLTLFDDF